MKVMFYVLLILMATTRVWAYPEMIRHGYTSCITCHISPNGRGILTPYGKSLANELLTQNWLSKTKDSTETESTDEEDQEVIEKWLAGGNARVLFFHRKNEYEDSHVTIPMQFEAYGAYNTEKYSLVLGAALTGRRSGVETEEGLGLVVSDAYGLYRLSKRWNIRAGLFFPTYGLNNSLHTIGTRGPLGFGFRDQRMGAELSYIGKEWEFFLSQLSNRGENLGDNASTAQVQYAPTKNSKVAVNYWTETDLRDLWGVWFVTPIYKEFYVAADYNVQHETKFDTDGVYYYAKFGYEFLQGMHAYLMKDFQQRDMDLDYTKVDRYGPGIQIFPRLHWEVDAVWLKEKNRTFSSKEADYAYILVHYYL